MEGRDANTCAPDVLIERTVGGISSTIFSSTVFVFPKETKEKIDIPRESGAITKKATTSIILFQKEYESPELFSNILL